MRRYEPTDDSVPATIQEAKSSMTDITRTVLRIPSITGQPYVVFSGPILKMYSGSTRYIFEPSELRKASNRPEGHNTVFNIPTITSKAVVTTAKLIRIWDDGHTRYISEHDEQHLGPDNPANDPPSPDLDALAANLDRLLDELEAHNKPERGDALRRVLKVLDDEDAPGIIGMDSVETYELALKLIAAVRG